MPLPLLPWLIAAVVAAAYLPAVLSLEYVWDDWHLFVHNPILRTPELVLGGITQPILPGTTYFRPFPLATMSAEFLSVGVNPVVSHAINLGLHVFNVLLVCWIMAQLTERRPSGRRLRIAAAGLFYGLHPALIEPVCWIAGRFDLLATTFMLTGIWGFLALQGSLRFCWVLLSFLLAALSKEMAVVMPLMLLLVQVAKNYGDSGWKEWWRHFWISGEWRLYVALGGVGCFYLCLRNYFIGALIHQDSAVISLFEGPIHHLAFIGQTILFYFKMALWPFADLNPQHPLSPIELSPSARSVGILVAIATPLLVVFAVRTRRTFSLLAAAFIIALLPVLNILPLTTGGNIGHERFLTFPLAMLALCIGHAPLPAEGRLSRSMQRSLPHLLAAIAMLWLGSAAANIRLTVPLWKSEMSLWSWTYARHADIPFVRFSYAAAALRYGDFPSAATILDSIELADEPPAQRFDVALLGLKGKYLTLLKQPEKGLAFLEQSEHFLPVLTQVRPPHEELEARGIRLDSAAVQRGNGAQWFYQFLYTAKADTQIELQSFKAAQRDAQIALFYAPRYPPALTSMSYALYGLDQVDEGDRIFQKALEYYVPEAREQALQMRLDFLERLCAAPARRTGETCGRLDRGANEEESRIDQGKDSPLPDHRGTPKPPA